MIPVPNTSHHPNVYDVRRVLTAAWLSITVWLVVDFTRYVRRQKSRMRR